MNPTDGLWWIIRTPCLKCMARVEFTCECSLHSLGWNNFLISNLSRFLFLISFSLAQLLKVHGKDVYVSAIFIPLTIRFCLNENASVILLSLMTCASVPIPHHGIFSRAVLQFFCPDQLWQPSLIDCESGKCGGLKRSLFGNFSMVWER